MVFGGLCRPGSHHRVRPGTPQSSLRRRVRGNRWPAPSKSPYPSRLVGGLRRRVTCHRPVGGDRRRGDPRHSRQLMLKNLKVTTKLVAILVAPVLVLVALAFVGVSQRQGDAREAERVLALTDFVGATTSLLKEVEREALLAA